MTDYIRNDTALSLLPQAVPMHPLGPMLSVVVKGTWAVAPGAEPVPVPQPVFGGLATIDDLPRSAALSADELAVFKPRAEVLWLGAAHAPAGRPVTALKAVLHLGGIRKEVAVLGDRQWQVGTFGARASEAEPFTCMLLGWDRAYGGADLPDNPSGRGRGDDPRLPNLEDPRRLIAGRRDAPAPVGSGPLNPLWPLRERILRKVPLPPGWHRQRPRRWPKDFAWEYLMQAPPDQRLPGYLRGDEELRLLHGHPAQPDWRLPLPAIRPQIGVLHGPPGQSARAEELRLFLDSVVIDTLQQQLTLLWRGLLPIASLDLVALRRLVLVQSPLAEPAQDRHRLLGGLRSARPPATDDGTPAAAGSGTSVTATLPPPPPVPRPPDGVWSRAQLERHLAGGGSLVGLALVHAALQGIDLSGRDLSGADLQGADLGGAILTGATLTGVRAMGLTAPGCDFRACRAAGADFSGADLRGAQLQEALLDGSRFDAARLDGADLSGASCAACSLIAASASGLEARGLRGEGLQADNADLERADLRDAELDGAGLASTRLHDADLSGARLAGARLGGSDLRGCRFTRAALDGADLAQCLAIAAHFDEATGGGVDLSHAVFREVDFTGARFPEATAVGSDLRRIRGDRSTWSASTFEDCDLSEASLVEADGAHGTFHACRLDRARLDRATLQDAVLVETSARGLRATGATLDTTAWTDGCDLTDACLAGATALRSNWQHAILVQVDGSDAAFDGATWLGCEIVRGRFARLRAPGAIWNGCSITTADWRGAQLTGAVFHHCRLRSCLFGSAMLYGVGLGSSTLHDCDLHGATLTGTGHG